MEELIEKFVIITGQAFLDGRIGKGFDDKKFRKAITDIVLDEFFQEQESEEV